LLGFALALLFAAAAFGGTLAVLYLCGKPAPRPASVVHAAIGAASIAALLLALSRGIKRTGMGTAGFGPTAAVLLALALLFGLRLAWMAWRQRRPSEILVFTHAGLAVAGLVLLSALVAIR
jgi:hypothetical protein